MLVRDIEGGAPVEKYTTTSDLPRFVGIPGDDQLIENSSLEGILHGRTISEVVDSDTQELEREGVTWETAVQVLKCLAVAGAWQDERISSIWTPTLGFIRETRSKFQMSEADEKQIEKMYPNLEETWAVLPGFSGHVRAYGTSSKVQFDDPIRGSQDQGDAAPLDTLAFEAPEREIVVRDSHGEFSTVVNVHTLILAERNHLLEKGNRYGLTGEQLARIVKAFDKEEFEQALGSWVDEKTGRGEFRSQLRHHEVIKYADGAVLEFEVLRGCLAVTRSSEPFVELRIETTNGKVRSINLAGEQRDTSRYNVRQLNIPIEYRDGVPCLRIRLMDVSGGCRFEVIDEGSPLHQYVRYAEKIAELARSKVNVLPGIEGETYAVLQSASELVNPVEDVEKDYLSKIHGTGSAGSASV